MGSAFFKISGGTTDQKIDVVAEKFCHLQRDLVEIQYQQLVLLQTISDLVVEDVGSYTLRMPDHRDTIVKEELSNSDSGKP
jgi:hypothetical protein